MVTGDFDMSGIGTGGPAREGKRVYGLGTSRSWGRGVRVSADGTDKRMSNHAAGVDPDQDGDAMKTVGEIQRRQYRT